MACRVGKGGWGGGGGGEGQVVKRWQGGKGARVVRWQGGKGGRYGEVTRWEVPGFIQEWGTQGESWISSFCF